jgi:DNA-binding transcriptional ArsR family regulator
VNADGSVQRFTSGTSKSGTAPLEQTEESWAIVRVKAAQGMVVTTGPARWYAPAPTLQTTATQADETTGDVTVGLSSYRATAEPFELVGDITLTFDRVEEGKWIGAGQTSYAHAFTAHVQGDVTRINLHAKPVYEQAPAAGAGLAVLIAVGAALAYYWPLVSFHATSAALPLYTRLKQPQILANEVRNSIYEIIRSSPGISAREVHRQSDQSWGTVVYHLRQLERHDLVVSRSVGRTRNYYENHGKYRGMEIQLACLQSPRARALARLVLVTPGIAQEDLAMRSQFPQPTTSYYIRKLKVAGLVEERREGRYARYHPMPDLARFLELADAHPAPAVGLTPASVEG